MRRKITTLLLFSAVLVPSLFAQTVTVTDADLAEDTDYHWTSDNTYVLDEMVFVKPGSRLYIEAGTVIQGELGNGNDATGLVVTRGAQIFAEGTPNNPIIFTSVEDDGSLTAADRGLWGGVILLGAASTNNPSEKLIEGVNEIASNDAYAAYGGTDDMDNSGVMRYVSIRHTGINVGDEAGNEIQGLTMGGVGSGTTLEFIESFASDDDGFEWFGGTVNSKYLVAAFNTDDGFDWDEGYRGKGQFWFAIQDESDDEGFGRAMELDGAGGDENTTPFGGGWVVNATILGAGETLSGASNPGDGSQLVLIRDNSGGKFYNNIFAQQHALGITVEDVDGESEFDSRVRLESGDLVMENNLWYNFGAGNSVSEFSDQSFVQNYLSDSENGNRVEAIGFRGISRTTDGGLDPRPASGSAAWNGAMDVADDFFDNVSYIGAFGEKNWLIGWTAIEAMGYVSDDLNTDVEEDPAIEVPNSIRLYQNYPNPFNPTTQISFTLPQAQQVTLKVYDMLGREVATLVNGEMFTSGLNTLNFNANDLSSGLYIYRLTSGNVATTRKMTLIK